MAKFNIPTVFRKVTVQTQATALDRVEAEIKATQTEREALMSAREAETKRHTVWLRENEADKGKAKYLAAIARHEAKQSGINRKIDALDRAVEAGIQDVQTAREDLGAMAAVLTGIDARLADVADLRDLASARRGADRKVLKAAFATDDTETKAPQGEAKGSAE